MDGGDAVRLPGSAGVANNKLLSPPLSSLRAASHLGGHMPTVSSCDGRALSDPRVPLGAGSQPREPPDHEIRKEHRWAKETAILLRPLRRGLSYGSYPCPTTRRPFLEVVQAGRLRQRGSAWQAGALAVLPRRGKTFADIVTRGDRGGGRGTY